MSLVGTRPPTLDEWDKYEPHHRARMSFRPGLTGLWQVSGRSNITDFEEVVKLDTQYIDNVIYDSKVLHSGVSGDISKENMPYLYLFIEKYKNSDLKELSRLASGLEKDLSAVENAIASPLSNGFVEGTNSKLKMIKRTMYGRCGKRNLMILLIFPRIERN